MIYGRDLYEEFGGATAWEDLSWQVQDKFNQAASSFFFKVRDHLTEGRGYRKTWRRRLDPAIDNEGEWTQIDTGHVLMTAATAVSRMRAGKVTIPPGEWEFEARDQKVFAKYKGLKS